MRLNYTYNFLRSGSLFYYRGIFSGLSNEPIGSASYSPLQATTLYSPVFPLFIQSKKLIVMSQTDKGILPILLRYNDYLINLAKEHLNQKQYAADIVKFVMEELYDQELLFEGEHLKPLLMQRVVSACNIINRLQQSDIYINQPPPYKNPQHP